MKSLESIDICEECWMKLEERAPIVCACRMEHELGYDDNWYCHVCGEDSAEMSGTYYAVQEDIRDILGWLLNLILKG